MNAKTVLVTGATGQQGGAVARHLLKQSGFAVRALVRDKNKESAKALAQQGAQLVQGDFDNTASLKQALEGAWGAYSVQAFMDVGYEGEIRQGKAFADAAKAAGVQYFVYSSVASSDQNTGLPHFDSKWQVEQYLRQLNLPSWTIVRPAFFMQNWYSYMREPILSGNLMLPCSPQTSLQQISVDDIGRCVAQCFQDTDKWKSQTIELAGDQATMQRAAELLSQALGRTVKYLQVPLEQFRQQAGEEMAKMYQWFQDVGYHVDINALRRAFPFLATLDQVISQQDWKAAETAARKAA